VIAPQREKISYGEVLSVSLRSMGLTHCNILGSRSGSQTLHFNPGGRRCSPNNQRWFFDRLLLCLLSAPNSSECITEDPRVWLFRSATSYLPANVAFNASPEFTTLYTVMFRKFIVCPSRVNVTF
jgi:hypothetical protein